MMPPDATPANVASAPGAIAAHQPTSAEPEHVCVRGLDAARIGHGTISSVARTLDFSPTAASAREAYEAGELAAWSQWFTRHGDPNMALADGLLGDDLVYLLAEFPLRDLYPCAGPSPEFDYPDDPDDYERRVVKMIGLFEAGWDAPPLYVHLPTLFLAEGHHRREALLRLGREHYWTVGWMKRPPLVGRGQHWAPRDDR
jgi:hypothetical protein